MYLGLVGASAIAFLADMSDLPGYWVVKQRWEHSSWLLLQALPRTDGAGLGSATSRLPAGSAVQSCLGSSGNGRCLLLADVCLEKTSRKSSVRKVCGVKGKASANP